MTEEFLHYAWKTRQFDQSHLFTAEGLPVEIIRPGEHNTDSGPDFFNARIKLGDMVWAGNVEIHLRTSDWDRHGHQFDAAYNNVILHVVYEADSIVHAPALLDMPTLELRERLNDTLYDRYVRFRNSKSWVACEKRLRDVEPIVRTGWLGRMMVERLEEKTAELRQELESVRYDWEEVFYRRLARHFGMLVNAEPFSWLTRSLPYRMLLRQRLSLLQLEALLFGQSGLLPEDSDDLYVQLLHRDYSWLRRKYDLEPMPAERWKFSRMRPSSFPTIRISQLAQLLHKQQHLFSTFSECETTEDLFAMLDVEASLYWRTHYRFGQETEDHPKKLGEQAALTILVNTLIPMLFLWSKERGDEASGERALDLLESLPAESNTLLEAWEARGMSAVSAGDGQALIHLKKKYCDRKRCLNCAIGRHLLEKL